MWDAADGKHFKYETSYIMVPPFHWLCLVCFFFPAVIGTYSTRLGFSLLVMRSTIINFAVADDVEEQGFEFQVVASMLARCLYMSIVQDTTCAVVAQSMSCLAMALTISVAGGGQGYNGLYGRWREPLKEVLFSAVICMFTACLQQTTKWSIRNEVEASSSKTFEKAAEALLSSMCDAVIHMSSEMCILKDSPRLCALLLQSRTTSVSLNFCDFISSDDDREKFRLFIRRPPDEAMAETIHISLCDSNSTVVPVQIFHTQCVDLHDQVVHLVGILDAGWQTYQQQPQCGDTSPDFGSLRVRDRDEVPVVHAISEHSLCSSTLSLNLDTTAADNDVKVWVSTSDSAFDMVKWTPSFLSFIGRSALPAPASFTSFVVHRDDVTKDLQHLTNLLLDDGHMHSLPWQCVLHNSSLQRLIDARGQVQIDLDMSCDRAEGSVEDPDIVLMIKFTSWKKLRPRRQRHTQPLLDYKLSL